MVNLYTIPSGVNVAGCYDYVLECYNSGKYDEAIAWCDHLLGTVEASNPLVVTIKNCKGKSIARKYFNRQTKYCDHWALLGYDQNCSTFKSLTEKSVASNKLLRRLSLYDVHIWEDLCSQCLQAINLLGEVLDSNKLDEEGSELLDLLLMDYSKEAGETSMCKRCLLCRVAGDLIPTRLQPLTPNGASEPEDGSCLSSSDQSIFILQSYMYIDGSQTSFMFCQECFSLLSHYTSSHLHFILEAIDPIKEKLVKYDKNLYICLVGHIAKTLPLTITGCCTSNCKVVYAAFLACRQILLSHDKDSNLATLPKMYFLVNPYSWYMFDKSSRTMHQLSPNLRNISALVANRQDTLNGGDSCECTMFLFHTGVWNVVLDFGSSSEILPEYLLHPTGGTYPIPSLKQRWGTLPPDLLHVFHDLVQADEHRGAFRSLLSSEGQALTRPSGTSLPLVSYSAKFLLPCHKVLSFLPEQFCVRMDSDNNIKSISVPDGHTIIGHFYDSEKDFTMILACASDVTSQEKQFYYIFVCRLWGYFIIEGVFLKGKLSLLPPATTPVLFQMYPSLGIQEVYIIRQLISKKFDILSSMKSLLTILMKYGHFDFIAASNYVDIMR